MKDEFFRDGPFKEDGTWAPPGGSELYFHSHLSEPDAGLDSDGLTEPIDRHLLDVATSIIRVRKIEDQSREERLRKSAKLIASLPRGVVTDNADRIRILHDGSPLLQYADGTSEPIPTGDDDSARPTTDELTN